MRAKQPQDRASVLAALGGYDAAEAARVSPAIAGVRWGCTAEQLFCDPKSMRPRLSK